ncbi:MAG: apolipoprotein N-acyltransferase [Rickettsiaceae bacterium]|nr:apolipoprotein N-acyltransferase [Rickettsiaceae bacterium]
MFTKIENNPQKSLFVVGLLLSLAFAPFFFFPALASITILAHLNKGAETRLESWIYGFWFGFGFFLSSLYWISIGVSVYSNDFWWAIPIAFFGIPLFMSIFISASCVISWHFRNTKFYPLAFAISWVFMEWVRSWLFTGFPWNLAGYSLCIMDQLIQLASIFGIYGLSLIVVFLCSSCILMFDEACRVKNFIFICLSIALLLVFGEWRLGKNETKFYDIKLRLVQANIPQYDKWDAQLFWENLESHVNLSKLDTGYFYPDIIIWPEAAVTALYNIAPVRNMLESALIFPNGLLITGGVSKDKKGKIYSSIYSIDQSGKILFEYHKSHLVPFGEYIPLRSWFPSIKKLTPGLLDYSPGKRGEVVFLEKLNLKIRPLICYESIFPREVITKDADVMINITNDTWYGNSSGPYQHFHIARMRAVENGIPMIRVANSGISAIIDPLGKIVSKTSLFHITALDGYLPEKIEGGTIYAKLQELTLLLLIGLFYFVTIVLNKKTEE